MFAGNVVLWTAPSVAGSVLVSPCMCRSQQLSSSTYVRRVMDDNLTVPGVAAFMGFMMLQLAVEVL